MHNELLDFFAERTGLKGAHKVASAESKVIDSLRDHCTYNPEAQNQPHLYSRVVGLMDPLDSLCKLLISRLQQSITELNITVPAQLSYLFQSKQQTAGLTILPPSSKQL